MSTYRIRSGDTLSGIAARYRTTVAALASANGIRNPNLIRAGATLRIPGASSPAPSTGGGGTYTVRAGDTLSGIAARHRTTVSALASANGIRNVNLIHVGQRLRLPGSAPAPAPVTPSTPSTGGVRGNQRLADAARRVALSMGGYRSQGWCAKGVSQAIVNTFGIKVWGNGNQIDDNLPRNKFKQVHIPLSEALKIPGLVLTWESTPGTLGRQYGHTAITAGDGRTSYSDFIDTNTAAPGRNGLKIFMPL